MLLENAKLIANAVAVAGQPQGGHTVQETGGQAAQTAVAEASVFFNVLQLFKVQTDLARQLARGGEEEGKKRENMA